MKKTFILMALSLMFLVTGCSNVSEKLAENTHTAIENKKYDDAFHYGKVSILEGNEDKQFSELVELLDHYIKATNALEIDDIGEAKYHFDRIDNFDGSGMTDQIEALENSLELELEAIERTIEQLENAVKNNQPASVAMAELELEKKRLTPEQNVKVSKLQLEWVKKKNAKSPTIDTSTLVSPDDPSSEPPANITPEQACEIAREELDLPDNAKITATQNGEYYIVNAEVDYGDHIDECGCKVSVYDGEVFDPVG